MPNETELNAAEPGSDAGADPESVAQQWEAEKAELQDRVLRTQAGDTS